MIYPPSDNGGADMLSMLRSISTRDLAVLAIEEVAYVKPVVVDGQAAYAIHAADGTQLGVAGDRDIAMVAVRQHELNPVSVH